MIFRLDLKIFIFLIFFYVTRQIKIYAIIMIFAMIHELSHIVCGILLKMKVKKITLMPLGLSVEFYLKTNKFNKKDIERKKIIVAIAGPVSNLLIIFLVKLLEINSKISGIIIYSNLLIAIFNLIPIYPLDGGRIIKSILYLQTKNIDVNLYINIISNIVLFFITFLFSILIYYLKNISILFILAYLWYIVLKQNKIYKMKQRISNILKDLDMEIDKLS